MFERGDGDHPVSTFTFHGYTVRSTRREDYALAELWTRADRDHTKTRGYFWLIQEAAAGIESFLVEDREGVTLFFKIVQFGEQAEIHLLFSPLPATPAERTDRNCRTMNAMIQIFPWVEKALALRGTKAVFFKSKSAPLIRFAEKRLDFKLDALDERDEWKVVKQLSAISSQPSVKALTES